MARRNKRNALAMKSSLGTYRFSSDDCELITRARGLIGLLDFEFFRTAWRVWHGSEPDDRVLEPDFVDYLFRQRAPDYVRHFARSILAAASAGQLDPAAFGLENSVQDSGRPAVRDDIAASGMVVILGLLLMVLI